VQCQLCERGSIATKKFSLPAGVVGGFFFCELQKNVSLGRRIERERPIQRENFATWRITGFMSRRFLWRSQMILSVIVIRYFTEVHKLFFAHSVAMLAFYHFNE
jgi:hypothetical protein